MGDDDLKLGKPAGDPVRLEYPDPPASGPAERPNAARVLRRSSNAEATEEDQPQPEPEEDNDTTE